MNYRRGISLLLVLFAHSFVEKDRKIAWGQGILNSTRFGSTNNSYYEYGGVRFGFGLSPDNGAGSRAVGFGSGGLITSTIGLSQPSSGIAPVVGGFEPGFATRFGFGRVGHGPRFSLGFDFAQGSSRQATNITPSIVLPSGGVGSFESGAIGPFVTGFRPVVGFDNGVTRAVSSGQIRPFDPRRIASKETETIEQLVDSSANRSMMGVSEIIQQKSMQRKREREAYLAVVKAMRHAEEKGNSRRARVLARKAVNLTSNADEKALLELKIKNLYAK